MGFPYSSVGEESACNAEDMGKHPPANGGDVGSSLVSGRSHLVGNGNPLQYSCLEIPMVKGAWKATVWSHSGWIRLSE